MAAPHAQRVTIELLSGALCVNTDRKVRKSHTGTALVKEMWIHEAAETGSLVCKQIHIYAVATKGGGVVA